jgi:hypothetical protein
MQLSEFMVKNHFGTGVAYVQPQSATVSPSHGSAQAIKTGEVRACFRTFSGGICDEAKNAIFSGTYSAVEAMDGCRHSLHWYHLGRFGGGNGSYLSLHAGWF